MIEPPLSGAASPKPTNGGRHRDGARGVVPVPRRVRRVLSRIDPTPPNPRVRARRWTQLRCGCPGSVSTRVWSTTRPWGRAMRAITMRHPPPLLERDATPREAGQPTAKRQRPASPTGRTGRFPAEMIATRTRRPGRGWDTERAGQSHERPSPGSPRGGALGIRCVPDRAFVGAPWRPARGPSPRRRASAAPSHPAPPGGWQRRSCWRSRRGRRG